MLANDGLVREQVDEVEAGQMIGIQTYFHVGGPGSELKKGAGSGYVEDAIAPSLYILMRVPQKNGAQTRQEANESLVSFCPIAQP